MRLNPHSNFREEKTLEESLLPHASSDVYSFAANAST